MRETKNEKLYIVDLHIRLLDPASKLALKHPGAKKLLRDFHAEFPVYDVLRARQLMDYFAIGLAGAFKEQQDAAQVPANDHGIIGGTDDRNQEAPQEDRRVQGGQIPCGGDVAGDPDAPASENP